MNELTNYNENTFESIKHINEYGQEYWKARELQEVLEYKEWRNFEKVIDKAKTACINSGNVETSHFVDVNKSLNTGLGVIELQDYNLSRYACYLIVQNADARKKVVALGQTYFAIKTRQQELSEVKTEEEKRLQIRNEITYHNKQLADTAQKAGVTTSKEFATFQNKGYQGLYGGLGAKEIHQRKGLKKSQKILDHMGSTELAANLFRATQAEEKIRKENIQGKENANQTHYEVGKKVRKAIKEIGGTMPEDLPTPEKSIKQIEKEKAKLLEKNKQIKNKKE